VHPARRQANRDGLYKRNLHASQPTLNNVSAGV
jgi:hypothetical protein